MTRKFTGATESGDLLFFDVIFNNFVNQSSVKRSGNYAYEVQNSGSTPYARKVITETSEIYTRLAIRMPSGVVPNGRIFVWNSIGVTELGSLRHSTALNNFQLYTGTGTLVATGEITTLPDVWYVIELRIKIADSPNGVISLKVDGVSDATFTGDTKPGSDTNIGVLSYTVGSAGQRCYFDDLALNDTAGAEDNSWCGNGRIFALSPNSSDNDTNEWVGQDADNDDNHLLVDEAVSDSDTTYVETSTPGAADLYGLTTEDFSGMSIKRVWVEAIARDTVPEGAEIKLNLKPSGVVVQSSDAIGLFASYTRVVGPEYLTNPADDEAWAQGDIDVLEIGQEMV